MINRLSTSNSDTNYMALLKALASPSAIVCLTILLCIECAVRITLPDGKLPKGGYPNAEVRQQHHQYKNEKNIDMLVVGSSVAAVNFPPVAIDDEFRKLGQKDFVTFNAGIRGCNFACISRGVEYFYLNEKLPKNILLVISPEDLDSDNSTVINRSNIFVNTLNRPAAKKWITTKMSDICKIFGFQEHIQSLLTTGSWDFDSATVSLRGHIDMGSLPRRRFDRSPAISRSSDLSIDAIRFTKKVASMGIHIIVLPALGDSNARAQIADSSQNQFKLLLQDLSSIDNVTLIDISSEFTANLIPDDTAYIDNLHLNSAASLSNGTQIARELIPAIF